MRTSRLEWSMTSSASAAWLISVSLIASSPAFADEAVPVHGDLPKCNWFSLGDGMAGIAGGLVSTLQAEQTGTYFISFETTATAEENHGWAKTELVVNGKTVAQSIKKDEKTYVLSAAVQMLLNKGDIANVSAVHSNGGGVDEERTTLSACLKN